MQIEVASNGLSDVKGLTNFSGAAKGLEPNSPDPFAEKENAKEEEGSDAQVIEEEDASDLYYDKELKLLLEDHKRVTKFTMIFSNIVMAG